ncbi:hypothetical protein SALBM135S_08572 [Streptomyces alboniger]
MYSQSSISSRSSSRSAPTDETRYGLTCVICGTDYRTTPSADALVVSRGSDGPTVACRGVCARMASGSATGLDGAPPPLAERVSRFEADRAQNRADQAQGDQPGRDA